jgi:hypothetical protein
MSDDRNRDLAFSVLEGALVLFPPLARAVGKAIDDALDKTESAEERSLLEEVKARLPVDGESERAARDLESK